MMKNHCQSNTEKRIAAAIISMYPIQSKKCRDRKLPSNDRRPFIRIIHASSSHFYPNAMNSAPRMSIRLSSAIIIGNV